uniref:Cation:H+ antiporter n=1 Tax=Candidatus Kentrum sp. SD TaxID=2126332 RepID=A0A450YH96_9GAMM|nr:MAG: cation:H+ antiporter [Candidatus Kentron sp. SD]VFK47351.1 MAG: cation:H+ antiporter [Candidatus Kentron sp. SD]VFK80055.1 MAG: cation:H+ antiporter [Candidatus Kentron sp. SD]
MDLLIALGIIVIASIVIMYACDSFDDAASYLGRNMAPGVRGATINAIGSSMPELMTAMFLLFLFHDRDGFAAGVATTAGSAIFNAVIIPALCIFAVRYKGILVKGTENASAAIREKVTHIQVTKSGLLRDGSFLLIAEAALIWFLGNSVMTWWMGGTLLAIYGVYFLFLATGFGATSDDDDGEEDTEEENDEAPSKLKALLTFDFNNLIYNGGNYTAGSAWVVLSLATVVIGIACWQLAEAVMLSASALGVPAYFTALIFAAAATSVPDTVLSVKDAMRGEYDDAISNAVGSNTFDITVGLGLPLLLYVLIFGNVEVASADQTQALRIVLFAVTVVVLGVLLLRSRVTVATAYFLLIIYAGWMGFVLYDMAGAVATQGVG